MKEREKGGAAVEIPNLKLAKVGPKRKARATGLPWLPEPHKGSKLALRAILGCKVGVLTLIGSVTAAAIGFGNSMAPEYAAYQARVAGTKGAKVKVQYHYDGDLSNLPSFSQPRDSVHMVSGGFQFIKKPVPANMTPAVDDVAGVPAAAASDQRAPEIPNFDINAIAAAAAKGTSNPKLGDAKSPFEHKLGFLKTNAAPKLAGGAGMAGGLGRGFDAPVFKVPAKGGELTALPAAKPQATRIAAKQHASYTGDRGRTLSGRQLYRANHFSNMGRVGGTESRATAASLAFDNGGSVGQSVVGAGASLGTSPTETTPPANPPTNEPGGGRQQETTDCAQTAQGCDPIPGKSDDPTSGIVKILQTLSWAISACLILKAIYNASSAWPFSAFMSFTMTNIIIGLGAIVAALGVVLMAMGRPVLGGIYTAVGALVAVLAWQGSFQVTGTSLVSWISAGVFAGIPFLNQKGMDGGVDTKKYNDHLGFMD
jgi:hypothetical protein